MVGNVIDLPRIDAMICWLFIPIDFLIGDGMNNDLGLVDLLQGLAVLSDH